MKLRITVALATLALAAPLAAHASLAVARAGDQTTWIGAKRCQVVKNADHSLTVHCSGTHWATLHWQVVAKHGSPVTGATLTVASARPLKYPGTLRCDRFYAAPYSICNITQRVWHNTITSVTVTIP